MGRTGRCQSDFCGEDALDLRGAQAFAAFLTSETLISFLDRAIQLPFRLVKQPLNRREEFIRKSYQSSDSWCSG